MFVTTKNNRILMKKLHTAIMSNTCPPLLTEKDPPPFSVTHGSSPLIFTGPHNGKAVPQSLTCSLGMGKSWFQTAHEASDLFMKELFEDMRPDFTEATFLEAEYSRLVCDLNRQPDYAVMRQSSENKNLLIPENQPECCCRAETQRRLKALHEPYHDTKNQIIETVRQDHGGAIVLDMHSFSPTWKGKQRAVEIGTIRCEKTPLSYALEEFWRNQSYYLFISGEPYRVASRPTNIAPLITESADLQYVGIEIRSDLIDRPEKRKKMVEFLKLCTMHLLNHSDLNKISDRRSNVIKTKPEIVNTSWSI